MSLLLLFQQNLTGTAVNLSGSASAIATATGALTKAVALAANAVAAATATGNLVNQGALSGNASAIASAAGALSLAINLASAAAAQASASATISSASGLAGQANAIASAVATLAIGTPLSGAAQALASASASLGQALAFSGEADVVSSAAGALSVAAALSASPNYDRTLQISEGSSWGPQYRMQTDGVPMILHSPGATLDYTLDWEARHWLAPDESIESPAAVVTDTGVTVAAINLFPSNAANAVQIWISGGNAGSTYVVTCSITTNTGRTDQRSFRLMVMLR